MRLLKKWWCIPNRNIFDYLGKNIEFNDNCFEAIADIAIEEKVGARGLVNIAATQEMI